MNWLSILIIVAIASLAIAGLRQGMVRAAFGIAGLIVGIALAGRYYDELAALLFRSGADWANILGYAMIAVATLVVAGIIGFFLSKLVNFAALGWLDKLVGLILGILIASLLCASILAIVLKYYPGTTGTIDESIVARFLVKAFPLVY
jgi:membrane protein required for colicin V production